MSDDLVRQAILGGDNPTTDVAKAIGEASKRLIELADEMAKAKDTDGARFAELKKDQDAQAQILSNLKAKADEAERESQLQGAIDAAAEWKQFASTYREPSKARQILGGGGEPSGYNRGDLLYGVHEARSNDTERQAAGKAILAQLAGRLGAKASTYEESWGKATLGTTDATGGWIIPNAIVDELIKPAAVANIYRNICTVVPGVTAATVDIPFRIAARTRATVIAWGSTKENLDLVYNGYTATMYTIARIHDVSNGFLRHSRGAAETDVLQELAAAFAAGESYYVREGSGSSEPFGYTSALTNGPAAFRSTFTPSATTLAGSIAKSIATAAGAVAGRGVATPDLSAVLSAASYWNMLSQGTDTAGFFFANPANSPVTIPTRTLLSPFGIPVYPDSASDQTGTAAVIDNLVVGDFKKFKIYFGESYRVDSSDQAGTRWDTNLTGFRGEEEMGFDARPAVYAGYFQAITDIEP